MNSFKTLPHNIKIFIAVLIFVTASLFVTTFILWKNSGPKKVPIATSENQVEQVVIDVSKVMILPENETPTLATVTDLTPLKDQPFFSKAMLGDLVLIYTNSKKAILWRPSTKQIVEVSSLNITSTDGNANNQ